MAGFTLVVARLWERLKKLSSVADGQEADQLLGKFRVWAFEDSTGSFVKQADPVTGERWIPSKRAIRQHGMTLRDTGRLMRSVRAEARRVGGGKAEVLVGTLPLVYAAIHQFGGMAGKGKRVRIPRRRYAGISPQTAARIAKALREAMSNA